jgi:hypothetical protein
MRRLGGIMYGYLSRKGNRENSDNIQRDPPKIQRWNLFQDIINAADSRVSSNAKKDISLSCVCFKPSLSLDYDNKFY